jgi:23S rRNA (guanosine2251-2'-O)-methyltransferase
MKLYGRNPVIERLRANPQSITSISIQEGFEGTVQIRKKARQHGVPVYIVPRSKMLKMSQSHNTQGIVMTVTDYEYETYDDLIERALEKNRTLVFIDEIKDPQNLGAIIRSLAALGRFSLVLPTHKSVNLTEAVIRVASGGDNYVPVAQVNNLNKAIAKAKQAGFYIAGTVVKGGQSLYETTLPHPLGLVVGSEQKGLRDVIRKNLDLEITIPMAVDTLSLNVAQAATVIGYEIVKQKKEYQKKISE